MSKTDQKVKPQIRSEQTTKQQVRTEQTTKPEIRSEPTQDFSPHTNKMLRNTLNTWRIQFQNTIKH
jgi:hypothetical protein